MKHSIKSTGNNKTRRILLGIIFGLKSVFLCGALIFLLLMLKEGAFSCHQQNFDIRSAVLISLGLAASICVMKGSTMLHGSEVKY